MDTTQTVWDLRRGVKFEPPPGWTIVEAGLPKGEDINHLDGLTYFWYKGRSLPGNANSGWRITTTPNSNWIPFPCIRYRDVYIRQDGFLGHEDPVLSPQLYNDSLPHLACISLCISEDPDSHFFRKGFDAEFIEPPSCFPRKCELHAITKSRCYVAWERLKLKYVAFVAQNGKDRHKRLSVIASQFDAGLQLVSRFRGTYLELKFCFSILCRLYLEIEAYYCYHRLSESHEFSMDTRPVDHSLVGTITTDETVCYRFHRMGIPVWLDRPLAPNFGVPCHLITEKIPPNPDFLRTPPGETDLVVARAPNVRPIFEGSNVDAGYILRISDWVSDCLRTDLGEDHPLRSFASYQWKPSASFETRRGALRKQKSGGSGGKESSKKGKKEEAQILKVSFATAGVQGEDLKRLLKYATPKPSSTWEALNRRSEPESRPSLRLVPALDVFTGAENVLQLKRLVYAWVKVKNRWLMKVSKELQPPEFANRRAWRVFMEGSFDPSPINPESEGGESRLRFAGYLGLPEPVQFNTNSTRVGPNPPQALENTVSDAMVWKVLHEVNEINFLHDVYEVELRRTWELPPVILSRLRHIAGGNKNPFEKPSLIPRRTAVERLRWIVALRDIVREWPSSIPKPKNFDLKPRMSAAGPRVEDVLALELAVANQYYYVAREILGRKPTIPLYK